MDTFVFSMGVVSTLVSVVCGVTLAYGGVNYILSRNDVNVFQKGVFMVSWTYLSGVLGFLLAMTFPLFVVLLVTNDPNFDFSNVKRLLSSVNNVPYSNVGYEDYQQYQEVPQEDSTHETTEENSEESREETNEQASEESPVCQKSVCEKSQCENKCDVSETETKLEEDSEKPSVNLETKKTSPKTALELLQEEITKIQESVNDGEVMEKLQTTD